MTFTFGETAGRCEQVWVAGFAVKVEAEVDERTGFVPE
jgi:hypothetical protein